MIFAVFLTFTFCFSIPSAYAHESEKKNVVVIHINEEGFEPKKINIQSGTEVVFENVGNEEYWPAADDHPSHTLYDGTTLEEHCSSKTNSSFDACTPIKSGETWSFVFTKEGVYEYHDHLWPQLTGQITVGNPENTEPESENIFSRFVNLIRKIFSRISNFFSREDAHEESVALKSGNIKDELYINLKNRFETIVHQSDPREAIRTLRDESSRDENTLALCHDLLHIIGHTAFDKYGSFKEAVEYQSDFCNSGYIHGLFESYFNSSENPLIGLSEQCSDFGVGKRQFDVWQCHHGIGHGFMYLTGGDLDTSLQLCKDGLQKPEAISSCQNGAYMEVFNLEILAKEKDFVTSENPFLTCQSREPNKEACYSYIPTYLSQTLGKDFIDIFKECDKAEEEYKHACMVGIGAEAIKRNMNNPNSVFALCKQAGLYIHQEACVSGLARMYMSQEGSYAAGKKLCERAPEFYQDTCDQTVSSRESFFK